MTGVAATMGKILKSIFMDHGNFIKLLFISSIEMADNVVTNKNFK